AHGEAGTYRNRPTIVLAKRIDEPFSIARSAAGDILTGHAGDWVMQYAPGDYGVVRADRFAQGYRFVWAASSTTLGEGLAHLDLHLPRHGLAVRVHLLQRAERRFDIRAQHRVAARVHARRQRAITRERGRLEAHVDGDAPRAGTEAHRDVMNHERRAARV